MDTYQAAAIIHRHRGDALVTNTMSAMFAITAVSPSPLNLASVPLMGGASGLGLGLAMAQPDRHVLVLDGDASLLMELGTLAQISDVAPPRFVHFVFNNAVQFNGLANVDRPGRNLDFRALAQAAGYASAQRIDTPEALDALLPRLLDAPGPHFVELVIEAPHKFTKASPQPEIPDLQFARMGAEAQAMMEALETTR
ncbi:thiamine pyrophosphate-dependent enzyme [Pukyongiella litopenaei]|uniref:Thiamine pyrophosphate-binding protein n=1 Tax=Pukyongiella litopenaei TaxID=2605946 RepID=A0A2S0MN18_9RHOB|nr:thiamine pyrophosphate-dependent enzyme [Pukyongiella litopenaei]AVO37275.1 thiamine pyrophosphate-binding protein [Pukyongiella litopenaei]